MTMSAATPPQPRGRPADMSASYAAREIGDTPSNAEAVTVASVQAMIDGLPNAEEITEENAEEVKAQLEAIDEAKEKLSDEEIDELDMTRYAEAAAALGALAAPMLLANDSPDEQFSSPPASPTGSTCLGREIPGEKTTICRTSPSTGFPLPMWGRLTPIPAPQKV